MRLLSKLQTAFQPIVKQDFDKNRRIAILELAALGHKVHWDGKSQLLLTDKDNSPIDIKVDNNGKKLYVSTSKDGSQSVLSSNDTYQNYVDPNSLSETVKRDIQNNRIRMGSSGKGYKSSGAWIREGIKGLDKAAGTLSEIASKPFQWIWEGAKQSAMTGGFGSHVYAMPGSIPQVPKELRETVSKEADEVALPVFNSMSPSHWINTAITGVMPWDPRSQSVFHSELYPGLSSAATFLTDASTLKGMSKVSPTKLIARHTTYNKPFIRNVGVIPEVGENGKVWLAPEGNAFVNVTWDLPFLTHKHYKSRPGSEYMVIDPKAFEGKLFFSTDPMDTFTLNFLVDPDMVTIVTGNPEARALAQSRGFKIADNEALDVAYSKIPMESSSRTSELNLQKHEPYRTQEGIAYNNAVTDYIRQQWGRSNLWDAIKLRAKTGVSPHVTGITNLQYHPSTHIEYDLGKKYGFSLHPGISTIPESTYVRMIKDLGSIKFTP